MDQSQYAHRPAVAGDKATPGTDRLGCDLDEGFSDAEAALLCCFENLLHTEQSTKRLRRALIDAGFAPGAASYLIRTSRLLERASRRHYRIRPFTMAASAPA
ncbi:MAG: hypothetical protein ACXV3F_12345 [Frankiaceae bacterium]